MNKILFVLSFLFALNQFTELKAQSTTPFGQYIPAGYQSKIKDGWYEATVYYYNTKTNQKANYKLDVYVQQNKVEKISFGGNESVHSGYNNSGYNYSGGYLYFKWNSNGEITSATSTVEVSYDYTNKQIFQINI